MTIGLLEPIMITEVLLTVWFSMCITMLNRSKG